MSNVIVAAVRPDQTGVANGVTANVRTVGGALGVAVMSAILASSGSTGGLPLESGYTYSFVALALAGVAAVLVATRIPADRAIQAS